jgi:hypothetical protein
LKFLLEPGCFDKGMPNYRRSSATMFKKSPSASTLKNRPVFHGRPSENTLARKFSIGICAMENKVKHLIIHDINFHCTFFEFLLKKEQEFRHGKTTLDKYSHNYDLKFEFGNVNLEMYHANF